MNVIVASRGGEAARLETGLGTAEFAFLRAYVRERSGIALGEDKRYLAEARLAPVARRAGSASPAELLARLMIDEDSALGAEVVEAMATHETLFFRDGAPFDALRDVMLPGLAAAHPASRTIRIWSAACSTGQEPYSIAMLVDELGEALEGRKVEILASDLSEAAVAQAREGRFNQFEAQRGLSIHRLLRHFEQEGSSWRIARRLRDRVTFRAANLTGELAGLGRFDVVFCRNALLYFDEATRADVVRRLALQIVDGGYLVIGAAETLAEARTQLRALAGRPGVFVKTGRAVPGAGAR